ncbi:MAG: type II secretion system protein [Alphaproteobacteria bacterium]|nr:type II secretion system protein [Alphaproteobacteria bacterium]
MLLDTHKLTRKRQGGFTLVELAIVMLIFGMVSGTALLGLRFYMLQQAEVETENALDVGDEALQDFFTAYGRYPCPANPTLGPGDIGYGEEQCAGAGIEIVAGERDADGDGVNDPVMIGVMPFNTLIDGANDYESANYESKITESTTLDGWGRKIFYAVTQSQTNKSTFEDTRGVISVVDEHNQSVLAEPDTAHYALASAGINGHGAYMENGERVSNCSASIITDPGDDSIPVYSVSEIENCDETDAIFLSGLQNDQDQYYYDDRVKIGLPKTNSHWEIVDEDAATLQAYNTNPGNVGVGVVDPVESFEVAGDLRADEVRAQEFCDPLKYNDDGFTPAICMDTAIIAGDEDSMNCDAPGMAVTAIEFNSVDDHCQKAFPDHGSYPPGFQTSCPPGQLVVGISNITGVICESP